MPKFLRGLISNNTMVGGFVRGEPTAPTLELIDVDDDESMKALSYTKFMAIPVSCLFA